METGTEARRGIGPAWVAIALGALVALALVVTARSEGSPGQPLELKTFSAIGARGGEIAVSVGVRNTGTTDIEVVDASLPDIDAVHLGGSTTPIRAGEDGRFLLRMPTLCPDPPELDRLVVRLRMGGHEHAQSLRFPGAIRWECR